MSSRLQTTTIKASRPTKVAQRLLGLGFCCLVFFFFLSLLFLFFFPVPPLPLGPMAPFLLLLLFLFARLPIRALHLGGLAFSRCHHPPPFQTVGLFPLSLFQGGGDLRG